MHNSSTSNIDSTLDTSAKPSTSSTAHTSEVGGESSQVKTEDTSIPSTSKENTPPNTSNEDVSIFNESTDIIDLSRTETESSSEQEMLRRRRLQKFSPPPTTD